MMYSLLFLTALLSQFQGSGGASTQTRTFTGPGDIAALNSLVVIGDAGAGSGAGDVSFSYYTFEVGSGLQLNSDNYVQALAGATANSIVTVVSGDLVYGTDKNGAAFTGLGKSVAIADANTVFVAQTSTSAQTGRVIVFEGNITSFQGTQVLIPYDGAHKQDSDAAFGESIDAKFGTLAVGCQLCNTSAPVHSGAVYVYKPTESGRWSESQVLTADGVYFLGEHVAIDDKVLIAAGDDYSAVHMSQHNFENIANTVVVYEEGHNGKFEQRQVLVTNRGSVKESITSIAVFDETIAVATMGSDTAVDSGNAADKIYIYYPMSERYGLATGKPKPAPQQWTNTQILAASGERYITGSSRSMVSISQNSIRYLGENTGNTNLITYTSTRPCLSCAFTVPTAVDGTIAKHALGLLTADHNDFYSFATATALTISDPAPNTLHDGCLIISLQDQYNDGWGIANLLVERPDGGEDRFTLQCATQNPNIFRYCPINQRDGVYHFRVENGEETPNGWEIIWMVHAHSGWFVGDRHTRMDFIWDTKYNDFHAGATKQLLPQYDTCEICDPNPPSKPSPKRRLSNLRSLHGKGSTSAPTVSAAPTIAQASSGDYWNQIRMIGADSSDIWFSASYSGAYFWVTNSDGSKLFHKGTSCSAVDTDNALCFLALPDGDYKLRVGTSVDANTRSSDLTFKFCYSANALPVDNELSFTVMNGECYAGSLTPVGDVCADLSGSSSAEIYLKVDVLLGGSTSSLSSSDESTLNVAVSDTLQAVLGTKPVSSRVGTQRVGSGGVEASVMVKFDSLSDRTALDNLVRETSSASSLLKYELIGSQTLSSHFLHGEVSSVRIVSVSRAIEEHDYSAVDESSFQTVADHVWKTPSVEQSSTNFNAYASYVAEGAYAVLAVAAVLAVSLFVKRTMRPKVEECSDDIVKEVSASFKPSFAPSDTELHAESVAPKRVKLTTLPQRSIDVAGLKNLAGV